MKTYLPTRRAILIGSSGEGINYLAGPSKDISNFKKFLKSSPGGLWHDNEILELWNPTMLEVANIVRNTEAEYRFTYFSGHGFTSADQRRMVCLRDMAVTDTFFFDQSKRQFTVVDACRTHVPVGIGGIPEPEEDPFAYATGSPARNIYDEMIMNSPEGKMILHATTNGMFSYDSPDGGYFTKSLLSTAISCRSSGDYLPVKLDFVLQHVQKEMKTMKNPQYPGIAFNQGHLNIPFCIATNFEQTRKMLAGHVKNVETTKPTINWEGVSIATLLLALIAGAVGSK